MTTPKNSRKPVTLGVTGRRVSDRLKTLRAHLMSLRALSERLNATGHPISADGLSKIEIGKRRVDVDDLMAIAIALDVSPLSLLLPASVDADEHVQLTDDFGADARTVWSWARSTALRPTYLQPHAGDDNERWDLVRFQATPRWLEPSFEMREIETMLRTVLRLAERFLENEVTRDLLTAGETEQILTAAKTYSQWVELRKRAETPLEAVPERENLPRSIEQQQAGGKFEVYLDRAGKWRFRLKATNGQVVATGEAYESKSAAKKGCESVQRAAEGAEAIEVNDGQGRQEGDVQRPVGIARAKMPAQKSQGRFAATGALDGLLAKRMEQLAGQHAEAEGEAHLRRQEQRQSEGQVDVIERQQEAIRALGRYRAGGDERDLAQAINSVVDAFYGADWKEVLVEAGFDRSILDAAETKAQAAVASRRPGEVNPVSHTASAVFDAVRESQSSSVERSPEGLSRHLDGENLLFRRSVLGIIREFSDWKDILTEAGFDREVLDHAEAQAAEVVSEWEAGELGVDWAREGLVEGDTVGLTACVVAVAIQRSRTSATVENPRGAPRRSRASRPQ